MMKAKGKRQKAKICLRMVRAFRTFAFCLLPFAFCLSISAQPGSPTARPTQSAPPSDGVPRALREVGIEQRLGEQIPLDLDFRDEAGRNVRLADLFGKRPVVLALVYYDCPMLCNQVLNGMESSLDVLSFNVGKEFEVVTVSFDPRETAELAAAKKQGYLERYKRPGAAEGWHFLTGDQSSIELLTRAVGFKYAWDQESGQYAHASGIMVLTPQGRLARYFYGIEYAPRDLKFGLIEASGNRIGSPVDQALLYCYHYDPATGKYGPMVMNIMRLGGALTLVAIIAMFILMRRKEPGRARAGVGGTA